MYKILITGSQVDDVELRSTPKFLSHLFKTLPESYSIHYASDGIFLHCFDGEISAGLFRYIESKNQFKHLFFYQTTFNTLLASYLGTSFDTLSDLEFVDMDSVLFFELLDYLDEDYLEKKRNKREFMVQAACKHIFSETCRESYNYDYLVNCIFKSLEAIKSFPQPSISVEKDGQDYIIKQHAFTLYDTNLNL